MPLTTSAKRALRKDRRRTVVNLRIQRRVKQAVDQAKKDPSAKNLQQAYSVLDRAAKKQVIHKSKAARVKSHLAKKGPPQSPPSSQSKKTPKKKSPTRKRAKTTQKSSTKPKSS
jgi:ribosomal protein S20